MDGVWVVYAMVVSACACGMCVDLYSDDFVRM